MTSKLRDKLVFHKNVTYRLLPFFYRYHKKKNLNKENYQIIGLVRERNEALLLQDTLDHLSQFVDGIVVFDDASEDESAEIAKNHPKVIEVIEQKQWQKSNRIWEEATNRKKLHDRAKRYNPEWLFYSDADERFQGDIRNFLLKDCPSDVNAIRVSLFDSYITKNDKKPYTRGEQLYDFRKYFGPERRDILMIWRNGSGADFRTKDGREPHEFTAKKEITKFYCQHYGKSLSIDHWEETCDYYVKHFPKYSDKWQARKGKAVHAESDFGRPLYTWTQVKSKSVKIN